MSDERFAQHREFIWRKLLRSLRIPPCGVFDVRQPRLTFTPEIDIQPGTVFTLNRTDKIHPFGPEHG